MDILPWAIFFIVAAGVALGIYRLAPTGNWKIGLSVGWAVICLLYVLGATGHLGHNVLPR